MYRVYRGQFLQHFLRQLLAKSIRFLTKKMYSCAILKYLQCILMCQRLMREFFCDWKKSFHHPQYSYFHFLLYALMHTHAECFAKKMNHLPSFYSEILQREMMICRWVLEKTSRRHAGVKFDEMLNQYKLNAAHWFAEINNVEKCNL